MKKTLLIALTSLFLAAPTMADEHAKGAMGADMAAGFTAWKKDLLRYGGEDGKMLAHEVDAWIKDLKRIQH